VSIPHSRSLPRGQFFWLLVFVRISNCLQADGEESLYTTKLLYALFHYAPLVCCPAAIKGNVTPGLVRILREFGPHPHTLMGTSYNISSKCTAVKMALTCLCQLMQYNNDHSSIGMWELAYDSGIIPVISELLTISAEPTLNNVRTLCTCLVLITPHRQAHRWSGKLPEAIAKLLAANPGDARACAADALISMCISDRDSLMDSSTWGLNDILGELAGNSDPDTAAVEQELLLIASLGLEVSSTGALHAALSACKQPQGLSVQLAGACSYHMSIYGFRGSSYRSPSHVMWVVLPRGFAGDLLFFNDCSLLAPPFNCDTLHTDTCINHYPSVHSMCLYMFFWEFSLRLRILGIVKAGASDPNLHGTKGHHGMTEGSDAAPTQQEPSWAPDPAAPGEIFGLCGIPPLVAARKVWACGQCGISAKMLQGGKLKECSRCRSVRYCGKACQAEHWPAHKAMCKRVQAAQG
jgi:hypothetical protein